MATTLWFYPNYWYASWVGSTGQWNVGKGSLYTNLAGTDVAYRACVLKDARPSSNSAREEGGLISVTGPTNGVEGVYTDATLFFSAPLAADVTISGSISFNMWGWEASMSANAALNCRIMRYQPDGTLTEVHKTVRTTELTTSSAAQAWSETPTSASFNRGDRIVLIPFFDDSTSSMVSGYNLWFGLGATTVGGTGDSYVTFNETLSFDGDPSGTTVYLTDSSSGLTTSPATLGSSFTGDENPLSEGGNWTRPSAWAYDLQKASGVMKGTTGHNLSTNAWATTVGPNVESYITMTTIPTGSWSFRVWFKLHDIVNDINFKGYWFQCTASTPTTVLRRYDGSTNVDLASSSQSWANGDKIGWSYQGGMVQVWRQASGGSVWTPIISAIDTTYLSTSGYVMLGTYDNSTTPTGTYDDFYVGDGYGTFTSPSMKVTSTSRGAGSATSTTATATGPVFPIATTTGLGGSVVEWYTPMLTATTLSGSIFVNAWSNETISSANAIIRCLVSVVDGDGTNEVPFGWGGGGNNGTTLMNTELASSSTVNKFQVSGDDVSISDGQRIRVRFYADDCNTASMANSYNVVITYAGTSGGASGDTYLTFPITLTEYTPPSEGGFPFVGGGYYP